MKRKIASLVLVLSSILMLTACGGGNGNKEESAARSKEHVYKSEEIAIQGMEQDSNITDFYIKNERMYVSCYLWKEESSTLTLMNMDMKGEDMKRIELDVPSNASYSWITVDSEGNYYAIYDEYFSDDSDPDNYIWQDDYYLIKTDQSGKEIWRQLLNRGNEDDYWFMWMQMLSDEKIAISDAEGIIIYDSQGNVVSETEQQEEYTGGNVYQMSDGTLVVSAYDPETGKEVLKKLNPETGETSGDYSVPTGTSGYGMYPGMGYDFFMVGNGSVYGYNLGDEAVTELMNMVDSDLAAFNIYSIEAVSKTEFYGLTDNDSGNTVLMKFIKVDPKDVPDKKVLTLACDSLDWEIRTQVVKFNKNNSDYRITIKDYSQYNTEEDYSISTTRLNTDIASGNIPDILVLNNQLPAESYEAKGLFEDLYPYIDKDEGINKEDFFPNVLSAFENNGKLYRLVPRFSVYTVVGKTADVGAEPGWSFDDLNRVIQSKPEGTQVFSEMTRNGMLNYSIQMSGENYIDWENGKCNFNSEGFIMLLEFAKQFPEELPEDIYTEDYWNNYDTMWREGKVLLNAMYLNDFSSYNYAEKGTFGEAITLIGFPAERGNGATMEADIEMVMSSKSKNKEGAWEFMRFFLTDAFQDEINYDWPLSMKRAEALAKEAQKNPTYEDEDGNMVEEEQTYIIGGMEIKIPPMTQEETDKVMDYVKSVDQVYQYNEELMNIITEEAAPYFSGQKNAKEVADIIQSRVQIYVSENR